jgi:hypothetical protein
MGLHEDYVHFLNTFYTGNDKLREALEENLKIKATITTDINNWYINRQTIGIELPQYLVKVRNKFEENYKDFIDSINDNTYKRPKTVKPAKTKEAKTKEAKTKVKPTKTK